MSKFNISFKSKAVEELHDGSSLNIHVTILEPNRFEDVDPRDAECFDGVFLTDEEWSSGLVTNTLSIKSLNQWEKLKKQVDAAFDMKGK